MTHQSVADAVLEHLSETQRLRFSKTLSLSPVLNAKGVWRFAINATTTLKTPTSAMCACA